MPAIVESLQEGRLGRAIAYKRGEFICLPGDPCDALYFVRQGSIEVRQVSADETQPGVGEICSAGQFFGELVLAGERHSRWLARALEDTSLLRIERTPLQRLLRERCGRAGLRIQTLLGHQDQLIFLCI
jgi:CRP-like cAMP-binding protein